MSRKRPPIESDGGLAGILKGATVAVAVVACGGAVRAVTEHFRNGEGWDEILPPTVPPRVTQQIEGRANPDSSGSDVGNEVARLARWSGSIDLDESAANVEKLTAEYETYPTSLLKELEAACKTELKVVVECNFHAKVHAFTSLRQVLDELLQVHAEMEIAHKNMELAKIKSMTEEIMKKVKELKKCQDSLRKIYLSDKASKAAATQEEDPAKAPTSSWRLSSLFSNPSTSTTLASQKRPKTSSSDDTQLSRPLRGTSSGSTASVTSTSAIRRNAAGRQLCRVEFCPKVSDGRRSNFMCHRHCREMQEDKSTDETAITAEDTEEDDLPSKKPAVLTLGNDDDISHLGESQETLFCFPTSKQNNLEATKKGETLDDEAGSWWRYPKACCCQCLKGGTEADPLYECKCTCKGGLKCHRLWHLRCQNELLSDEEEGTIDQLDSKTFDPKTFHCSECVCFAALSPEEQRKYLPSTEDYD